MADGTKIEWTDATWNPITGCSVLSAGCKHCYAMKLAGTRMKHHESRKGLTIDTKAGPVWNGIVRFNDQWLSQPLAWSKARMIFVNAHGDTFHHDVPDAWIDQILAVAALARQHVFQVLTKRGDRMRAYFADPAWKERVLAWVPVLAPSAQWNGNVFQARHELETRGYLPNVWLGVSVEDQDNTHRLDDLRETAAAVRWVSCEPLLGELDLTPWLDFLGWVVVGGESDKGPRARPMHPGWADGLLIQCLAHDVPFLFKQWGDWHPFTSDDLLARDTSKPMPAIDVVFERSGKTGHAVHMWRIGKDKAGRLLGGRAYDGLPA